MVPRRSRRVTRSGAEDTLVRPAASRSETPTTPAEAAAPGTPQRGRARHTQPRIAIPPSGRQRHEEKITVYVSEDELLALEQTRLVLRADYGLTVDRGRIVREAIAVLLADFEEYGESSMLVQRLSDP